MSIERTASRDRRSIRQDSQAWATSLVCPRTKRALHLTDRGTLATDDGAAEFTIIDGIPVLFVPEALRDRLSVSETGLVDYGATLADNEFYSNQSWEFGGNDYLRTVEHLLELQQSGHLPPFSSVHWVDSIYDFISQAAAYTALGSLEGQVVAQVGGSGTHAAKFCLARPDVVWLFTPSIDEARSALVLADTFGCSGLRVVVASGEELPIPGECLGRVYMGGSLHHTDTSLFAKELERVLQPGGIFAASDPYSTPLHRFGTRILGKRERDVNCVPLSAERLAPMKLTFTDSHTLRNGPILRYLLIGTSKLGLAIPPRVARALLRFEEYICTRFGSLRQFGGSVCTVVRKNES